MATLQRNKLGYDAAADSISADSLSFAGLVSIQEQQPNLPAPNQDKQHYQVSKQDQDFEFSTVKAGLNSAVNPFKITPADMLISNGQIKPHAIAFQSNPSFITHPPISLRSLLAIEHISSSNMADGQTSRARKYHEQLVKARNHKNKERTVTRTWFGQKLFRSFISPCRKCQAIQPGTVKGQTVPGERYKIH